jgi:hypothetical protein
MNAEAAETKVIEEIEIRTAKHRIQVSCMILCQLNSFQFF